MTIEHQIVTDADGNPIAAQIPWTEFEKLKQQIDGYELDREWSNELHKRAEEIDHGEVDLVEGEDFLKRLKDVV
ncbi:MAG: hypothetical protein AAF226_14090 [Verrucomicrobiota bacterium]